MNAITTYSAPQSMSLLPSNMGEAMKLAELMSQAKLLPQAVQNPADAFLVINQAMRWGMDPFAVAQEVSVIQGKLMHSGKIVAAAVQSSGVLDGRLHYDYSGAGENRTVVVSGKMRGETESREVSVRVGDAKTQNKVWVSQPDQQLAYHGARVWARRYAPEVMLGVYSPEEFEPNQQPEIPPARGPVVELTSTPVAPAQPWPMFAPDGSERDAKGAARWTQWCVAAIGKLEDAAALVKWREAMQPHFEALEAIDAAAVEKVQGVANDKLDALADQQGVEE